MGGSGKPDIAYRLADHIAFVEAFVDTLGLSELTIVAHDWGVAIALDLLRRRPELVRGVALMEAHLRPLPSWDSFDEGGRELFGRLRTAGSGEQLALDENFFIETLLPAALARPLTAEEIAAYSAPYPDPPSRRPLLQWAREIPIGGEPVLVGSETVEWCRAHLTNLTIVDVGGPARHFLPEDRPLEVAQAIIGWLESGS